MNIRLENTRQKLWFRPYSKMSTLNTTVRGGSIGSFQTEEYTEPQF